MFCPQCRAEYRLGFTRYVDCDVELVPVLTEKALLEQVPVIPGDPDEDPFCSFWEGEDLRIHTEICQLLDEQNIPRKTVRRRDHLFNLSTKSEFQIGVPYSFFEKAEAAVKEAYASDSNAEDPPEATDEEPSPLELPESTGAEPPDDNQAPKHKFIEDANVEVWSSVRLSPGTVIALSLNENFIRNRFDRQEGHNAIFVFPEDEARAREIVREIVEGVPIE